MAFVLPDTGQEISMGASSAALGLASENIGLNSVLGVNRSVSTSPISDIGAGSETQFSQDFGGLGTTNDYVP